MLHYIWSHPGPRQIGKTGYFIVFHIFKLSVSMIFTSSSCVKLQEVIKKIPSFSKIFSTTPAYTSTTSSLPLIFMPLNEMASRVPLSNTMSYFPGFQSPLKDVCLLETDEIVNTGGLGYITSEFDAFLRIVYPDQFSLGIPFDAVQITCVHYLYRGLQQKHSQKFCTHQCYLPENQSSFVQHRYR
ncbi:YIL064W-like protein [Saccharomyces cerevisiae FostersO]|nr:YIL064W-like protein [Saccharomyces cerevisiae FostersO]